MSDYTIPTTEKEKIEKNGNELVAQANTAVILTPAQYTSVIGLLDVTRDFQKAVKAVWDPVCESANKAHKSATKARADQIAPFMEAEKILKKKLNEFDQEQERIAREEETRRRKEKEERDRKLQEEQDRKLALAAELEKKGKVEEAQDLLEDAADIQDEIGIIPEPFIEKDVPKGVTYIDNWKAVVIDPWKVPAEFCIPDQKKLDQYAKMMKGENPPAGVRFVNERTIRRV